MLCSKCQKNQATHFMEKNINGKVTKLALCSECAKKSDEFKFDPFEGFKGFDLFDNMFGFPQIGQRSLKPSGQAEKRCTLCASAFRDLMEAGKVGCAECYKVFRDELEPTVRRIHGDRRHIGRRPLKAATAHEADAQTQEEDKKPADPADKIRSLRKELKDAVKAENYEEAARLRDAIRELEA